MDRARSAAVIAVVAAQLSWRGFADNTGTCDSSGWCASPAGPNQMYVGTTTEQRTPQNTAKHHNTPQHTTKHHKTPPPHLASYPPPHPPPHPPSLHPRCRDDAGPPWLDDGEHYPNTRYHTESPAWPVLNGGCPAPLADACVSKGAKAAHLDGPGACGGSGWFCRIMPDDEWEPEGGFRDGNFAHCNASDADERDDDGHCHGSSYDDT